MCYRRGKRDCPAKIGFFALIRQGSFHVAAADMPTRVAGFPWRSSQTPPSVTVNDPGARYGSGGKYHVRQDFGARQPLVDGTTATDTTAPAPGSEGGRSGDDGRYPVGPGQGSALWASKNAPRKNGQSGPMTSPVGRLHGQAGFPPRGSRGIMQRR